MRTNGRRMDAIQKALDRLDPWEWLAVYQDERAAPGERYWINDNEFMTDEQFHELEQYHPRLIILEYVDMTGIEQ